LVLRLLSADDGGVSSCLGDLTSHRAKFKHEVLAILAALFACALLVHAMVGAALHDLSPGQKDIAVLELRSPHVIWCFTSSVNIADGSPFRSGWADFRGGRYNRNFLPNPCNSHVRSKRTNGMKNEYMSALDQGNDIVKRKKCVQDVGGFCDRKADSTDGTWCSLEDNFANETSLSPTKFDSIDGTSFRSFDIQGLVSGFATVKPTPLTAIDSEPSEWVCTTKDNSIDRNRSRQKTTSIDGMSLRKKYKTNSIDGMSFRKMSFRKILSGDYHSGKNSPPLMEIVPAIKITRLTECRSGECRSGSQVSCCASKISRFNILREAFPDDGRDSDGSGS
ncbi:hypothetical protein B0H19DRAFT_1317858, partial [Mycena capillaripes]